MNRGQLAFLVVVNAMVSLVIALAVVWAFEARRPDPEELAAINTPRPDPVLALPVAQPTPTVDLAATTPAPAVATETPTPESVAPPAEEVVYVVQPGDTMLVIATRYEVTVQDILAANNLNDPNFVFAGQRLVIPVQGVVPEENVPDSAPVPTVAPQSVRIAAITGVGDLPNEQIILTNESNTPYSLQGWQVQRGDGVAYTFRSDVPLFPGGSIRLHSGAGTDTSIDLYWGQSEAVWQAGAEVRLVSAAGDTINTFLVP
jgi:LysM repeat protein